MLADFLPRDAVARTAIERLERFDAAQGCAELGDRWRYVITDPSCDRIGRWAPECYRRREGHAAFVGQEHRIEFDHIGRYALTGARDWRQRLEDGESGQPLLTRRRRAVRLRRRELLATKDLGSRARHRDSGGFPNWPCCKQKFRQTQEGCRHVPTRYDPSASV